LGYRDKELTAAGGVNRGAGALPTILQVFQASARDSLRD